MTFTSLTGCLEASILIDVRFSVGFSEAKKIERESGLSDGVVVVSRLRESGCRGRRRAGWQFELFALVGGENQSLAYGRRQLVAAAGISRDPQLHVLPMCLASPTTTPPSSFFFSFFLRYYQISPWIFVR